MIGRWRDVRFGWWFLVGLVLRGRVPVLGLVGRRLRAKNVSGGFQRFLQYLEWLAVCHCAIESRWTASLGSVLLKDPMLIARSPNFKILGTCLRPIFSSSSRHEMESSATRTYKQIVVYAYIDTL